MMDSVLSHDQHAQRGAGHGQRNINGKKKRVLASSGNFSFVCRVCSKEFSGGRALGGHMRIHGGISNCNPSSLLLTSTATAAKQYSMDALQTNKKKNSDMYNNYHHTIAITSNSNGVEIDLQQLQEGEVVVDIIKEVNDVDPSTSTANPFIHRNNSRTLDTVADVDEDPDKLEVIVCKNGFCRTTSTIDDGCTDVVRPVGKEGQLQLEAAELSMAKAAGGALEASLEQQHRGRHMHDHRRLNTLQQEQLLNIHEPPASGIDTSRQVSRKDIYRSASAAPSSFEHYCLVCSKGFSSSKAVFGHMRCHPERAWRGAVKPPNCRSEAGHMNDVQQPSAADVHDVNDRNKKRSTYTTSSSGTAGIPFVKAYSNYKCTEEDDDDPLSEDLDSVHMVDTRLLLSSRTLIDDCYQATGKRSSGSRRHVAAAAANHKRPLQHANYVIQSPHKLKATNSTRQKSKMAADNVIIAGAAELVAHGQQQPPSRSSTCVALSATSPPRPGLIRAHTDVDLGLARCLLLLSNGYHDEKCCRRADAAAVSQDVEFEGARGTSREAQYNCGSLRWELQRELELEAAAAATRNISAGLDLDLNLPAPVEEPTT